MSGVKKIDNFAGVPHFSYRNNNYSIIFAWEILHTRVSVSNFLIDGRVWFPNLYHLTDKSWLKINYSALHQTFPAKNFIKIWRLIYFVDGNTKKSCLWQRVLINGWFFWLSFVGLKLFGGQRWGSQVQRWALAQVLFLFVLRTFFRKQHLRISVEDIYFRVIKWKRMIMTSGEDMQLFYLYNCLHYRAFIAQLATTR